MHDIEITSLNKAWELFNKLNHDQQMYIIGRMDGMAEANEKSEQASA